MLGQKLSSTLDRARVWLFFASHVCYKVQDLPSYSSVVFVKIDQGLIRREDVLKMYLTISLR